jgi:hypothetical protein
MQGTPVPAVDAAIARIAPTLRSLRHVDGSLVRAHGGGRGAPGRLVTALVQSRVRPMQVQGLAMGFARMAQGRASVIADAAAPMLGPRSTSAHAGTLSFEMTVGDDPLIVNCGSGARFDPEWRLMGRATDSHSTLGLEGYASARFGPAASHRGDERPPLVDGPTEVLIKEQETEAGHGVTMSHDGWRRTHGLTHLRNLTLEDGGTLLRGEDALAAFTAADRTLLDAAYRRLPDDTGLRYAIRFHLHPDVRASDRSGRDGGFACAAIGRDLGVPPFLRGGPVAETVGLFRQPTPDAARDKTDRSVRPHEGLWGGPGLEPRAPDRLHAGQQAAARGAPRPDPLTRPRAPARALPEDPARRCLLPPHSPRSAARSFPCPTRPACRLRKALADRGVELLSTGGTAAALRDAG